MEPYMHYFDIEDESTWPEGFDLDDPETWPNEGFDATNPETWYYMAVDDEPVKPTQEFPKPATDERLDALEAKIAELKARLEGLGG